MSKASKKLKKPLDLPLGKAISHKDVDLSHVRLPIDTSVLGLKHVLTLLETATNEVIYTINNISLSIERYTDFSGQKLSCLRV